MVGAGHEHRAPGRGRRSQAVTQGAYHGLAAIGFAVRWSAITLTTHDSRLSFRLSD